VDQIGELDLMEEIRKVRKEMGGPFFNKKDNQELKKKHREFQR
jgi:hypothetical protein